ncbi:Sec-independent protein translocase protein TatB [Comamonas nitrativorans]|uniref:Sec-independent protein translocase protein TatB n=1 Tax=Comamonas nitrativorans TaxID=108437 RepID=A0ABV9GXU8_9BURK|nr:Sec-independent protein translocase protein TatB [Comamonas sp.]
MLDLGLSKMALIGAVALIVIGPEKLPRVARTVGSLLGRAQRYVADVKAEVNRSMELDELRKMKESVESAARDVQSSVQSTAAELEKDLGSVGTELKNLERDHAEDTSGELWRSTLDAASQVVPAYRHPGKNFRLKRGAVPRWYKTRQGGLRTHVQSGAARVARFRPKKR